MAWNKAQPPNPPGEWHEVSTGMEYRAYLLECSPLFHVQVISAGGEYRTQFNGEFLGKTRNLNQARNAAEAELVRRVRQMLPAYRVIFARYEARQETANVTPIRPERD